MSARTLSITFDNLGEAADLELGLWPRRAPVGRHPSVLEVLPRLLELLGQLDLPATFFVEGINAEVYPDALRSILTAGHELACHAWRHEQWSALDPDTEAERLARATAALASLGPSPRGFRPPGGRLTEHTAALLRDHGYAYASPAGDRVEAAGGLAYVPFRWELVDAWYYLPGFRAAVEDGGGGGGRGAGLARALPAPLRTRAVRAAIRLRALRGGSALRSAAATAVENRGARHVTLLFHPFLLDWTGAIGVLGDTLAVIAEEQNQGGLRVMPMTDIAEELLR